MTPILMNSMGALTFGHVDQITLSSDTDVAVVEMLNTPCGVLFLEGGEDINPALYQEANRYASYNDGRDAREVRLLQLALRARIPIIGVCRGHQLLAAILGGTLYQDLALDTGNAHVPYHTVRCEGPFAEYVGASYTEVNSYHHQAVRTIPSEAVQLATALDGVNEALWYPRQRAVSFQWHPEFIDDIELLNWALRLIGLPATRYRADAGVIRY